MGATSKTYKIVSWQVKKEGGNLLSYAQANKIHNRPEKHE